MQTSANNFIKKETLAQVFFCEFCDIFKNSLCTTAFWVLSKYVYFIKVWVVLLKLTNLNGWLIFGLRLVKCHSPIWIKCKWQQRFCATELSVHESSAFVSNYEHIFSFRNFFLQLQALNMMGSPALIFSYPAKIDQLFSTLWSIENVLWSIEQRHKIDDSTFHF